MVQRVGLLPRGSNLLSSAFDVYEGDDEEGPEKSSDFKRKHSSDVKIKFIGVWYAVQLIGQLPISFPLRDTVESVGPAEKRLPFCVSNGAVGYFRHAISLDERRVMFSPTYYHAVSQHEIPGSAACKLGSHVNGLHMDDTDVKEVFFAGVHCGTLPVLSTNNRQIIYRCPSRCRRWSCAK